MINTIRLILCILLLALCATSSKAGKLATKINDEVHPKILAMNLEHLTSLLDEFKFNNRDELRSVLTRFYKDEFVPNDVDELSINGIHFITYIIQILMIKEIIHKNKTLTGMNLAYLEGIIDELKSIDSSPDNTKLKNILRHFIEENILDKLQLEIPNPDIGYVAESIHLVVIEKVIQNKLKSIAHETLYVLQEKLENIDSFKDTDIDSCEDIDSFKDTDIDSCEDIDSFKDNSPLTNVLNLIIGEATVKKLQLNLQSTYTTSHRKQTVKSVERCIITEIISRNQEKEVTKMDHQLEHLNTVLDELKSISLFKNISELRQFTNPDKNSVNHLQNDLDSTAVTTQIAKIVHIHKMEEDIKKSQKVNDIDFKVLNEILMQLNGIFSKDKDPFSLPGELKEILKFFIDDETTLHNSKLNLWDEVDITKIVGTLTEVVTTEIAKKEEHDMMTKKLSDAMKQNRLLELGNKHEQERIKLLEQENAQALERIESLNKELESKKNRSYNKCLFIRPKKILYGDYKIDTEIYQSNGCITRYTKVLETKLETKRYNFYLNVDETSLISKLYTDFVYVDIVENEQITHRILMTETDKSIRKIDSTTTNQTFTASKLLLYVQKDCTKSFDNNRHKHILKNFPSLKLEYNS